MQKKNRMRGMILIFSLLGILTISVVLITCLQFTSWESRIAEAFADKERARLALDSGITEGMETMRLLLTRYPDSTTVWQRIPEWCMEGTFLYFRSRDTQETFDLNTLPQAVSPSDDREKIPGLTDCFWPLISGGRGMAIDTDFNHLEGRLTEKNSIDMNRKGMMGRDLLGDRRELRAIWVEILRDPTKPRIIDKTHPEYNPPVARYAYWMEDESFKIPLHVISLQPRGQSPGKDPSEISPYEAFDLDTEDGDFVWNRFHALRALFPHQIPGLGSLDFLDASLSEESLERLRFLCTLDSASYDVSRGGARRLQINEVFLTKDFPRRQMNRVLAALLHPSATPRFGQRFYRRVINSTALGKPEILNDATMVSVAHEPLYHQRFVANLRDYLDADSQPTLIENREGFPVREEGLPLKAWQPLGEGNHKRNPMAAIGKENIPRLHEYAIQARLYQMDPPGWSKAKGKADFDFTLDHYFEFWNMGTRDIALQGKGSDNLGEDAFLAIGNQPSLSSPGTRGEVSPPIPEGRPIFLPLRLAKNTQGESFRIPAGGCVVLTTDPHPSPVLLAKDAQVFILPTDEKHRRFKGMTTDYSDEKTEGYEEVYNHTYRVTIDPRTNTENDYETSMFLGNRFGLLESFCALPIVRDRGYALSLHARFPHHMRNDSYFVRGGNLRGNSLAKIQGEPTSASGDPRSLNEPIEWNRYEAGKSTDSLRFYWNGLDNDNVPARSSMGSMQSSFVQPMLWPDPMPTNVEPSFGPVWIANEPMQSIGELGHLYDPARILGTATRMEESRGGGRSFKIGQPERWNVRTNPSGLWDGDPHSASRTWVSWRLTDLFTVSKTFRLAGTINPNGVQRDGGRAMLALFEGMEFRIAPEGGKENGGSAFSAEEREALADAVIQYFLGQDKERMQDDRIFRERGEISEVPWLDLPAFLKINQATDREREEWGRRIMGLLTPRGSVFSIYAVGQAVRVRPDGEIQVLATREKVTRFELTPIYTSETDDQFDPDDKEACEARFAPPKGFQIKILRED